MSVASLGGPGNVMPPAPKMPTTSRAVSADDVSRIQKRKKTKVSFVNQALTDDDGGMMVQAEELDSDLDSGVYHVAHLLPKLFFASFV